jgi:hypothetical protein
MAADSAVWMVEMKTVSMAAATVEKMVGSSVA